MKLKRVNMTLSYYEEQKVLEWLILTRYNPLFISTKIKAKEQYINELYYLNQSHTECNEVYGLVSVSYPVDKLVELIIDEKKKLENYKKASEINLEHLNQVMSSYTIQEQRQLIKYLSSNGAYCPDKALVERLRTDLYRIVHPIKQSKIRQFNARTRTIVYEHVNEVKATLNNELEVLTV